MRPEDIEHREFVVRRRGYDPEEVRAFLAQVAEELRAAEEHTGALEAELHAWQAWAVDVGVVWDADGTARWPAHEPDARGGGAE